MGHNGPRRFCSEVCKNKWYHDRNLRNKINNMIDSGKICEIKTGVQELHRLGFKVNIS